MVLTRPAQIDNGGAVPCEHTHGGGAKGHGAGRLHVWFDRWNVNILRNEGRERRGKLKREERETETERQEETDRQTDRQTDRHRERERLRRNKKS